MEHILKTAVVFIAILGALVVWHELGHFIVAKLVRMKVHEFALGFGPRILKLFKRGDTEFNVRAIPLGGFVRIAGMEPGDEEAGGFNAAPAWHRALVVLAGPVMSLLLGYLVFLMIGFVWGFPSDKLPPTTKVGMVVTGSPADKAGLQVGDTIIAIDGKLVHNNGKTLRGITTHSGGKLLTFEISRNGRRSFVKATPKVTEVEGEKKGTKQKIALIGIVSEPRMVHAGFVTSVKEGTTQVIGTIVMFCQKIFSREIGQNVGGIVMIGYATSETVKAGPYNVFVLLALLSLSLGIMNLLPMPVLDGGHLLLISIEKIRGKKMKPETWATVQMVGMFVLVALMVFLVGFDLFRIGAHKLPQ